MYHRKMPPCPISTLGEVEISRPAIWFVWPCCTKKQIGKREVRPSCCCVAEVKDRDRNNEYFWKTKSSIHPEKLAQQVRSNGQQLFPMKVQLKCFKSLQTLH